MAKRPRCGLPLHTSAMCIFHAKLAEKSAEDFLRALRRVFSMPVPSIFDQRPIRREFPVVDEYDFSNFICPIFELPSRVNIALVLDGAELHTTFRATGVRFLAPVSFRRTLFRGAVEFDDALLQGGGTFYGATFESTASFRKTSFDDVTSFENVTFREGVDFASASFSGPDTAAPIVADLRGVMCDAPYEVRFVDINRRVSDGVLVHLEGAAVEQFVLERVNWYCETRAVLQDEIEARRHPFKFDFAAAESIYRHLVRSFESQHEHELAEDFYWGLMEMRRRNPKHVIGGRRLRQIYESSPRIFEAASHVSVAGAYRLASFYGSSYTRAIKVLIIIVLFFGLIYTIAHASIQVGEDRSVAAPLWAGMYHSFEIAMFTRRPLFEFDTPAVRAVELLEAVLVPTQVALVLLAVRRRFAR